MIVWRNLNIIKLHVWAIYVLYDHSLYAKVIDLIRILRRLRLYACVL